MKNPWECIFDIFNCRIFYSYKNIIINKLKINLVINLKYLLIEQKEHKYYENGIMSDKL